MCLSSSSNSLVVIASINLFYTVWSAIFNLLAVYRMQELDAWLGDLNKLYELEYQTNFDQTILVKSWLMIVPCLIWDCLAATLYALSLCCGKHHDETFKAFFVNWLALAPIGHVLFDVVCFTARASLFYVAARNLDDEGKLDAGERMILRPEAVDFDTDPTTAKAVLISGCVVHSVWLLLSSCALPSVCRYRWESRKRLTADQVAFGRMWRLSNKGSPKVHRSRYMATYKGLVK